MSHYVEYFTVERSMHGTSSGRPMRRLRAACGQFVDYPAQHDTRPECPTCKAYLEADPYAGKSGDKVF